MKTPLLTSLALIAFAGNSVLCKLALGEGLIDASSFTSIRLFTGIAVLVLILKITQQNSTATSKGSWRASFMLFIYAAGFSFAYISLDTGTGALILFAAVQITIILASLLSGNKLYLAEWLGIALAFFGFIYLMLPDATTPSSLSGFIIMSIAGIAWGLYTLAGKNSKNPLSDTTYNFIRTLPFIIILIVVTVKESNLSQEGVLLAMLSGGLASGIGYTIWYMALNGLSSVQAAVVQLLVPVIATLGGILFIDEILSTRLVISSLMILGGILLVIAGKHYYSSRQLR